nr:MAG TPA: hypothetical protein [Caudoviricetes sp.]
MIFLQSVVKRLPLCCMLTLELILSYKIRPYLHRMKDLSLRCFPFRDTCLYALVIKQGAYWSLNLSLFGTWLLITQSFYFRTFTFMLFSSLRCS